MSKSIVKDNFKDWACSFSGCDGGNINGEIWYCGIEWGFGKTKGMSNEEYESQLQEYYQGELKDEIARGAYKPSSDINWKDLMGYQFGQKMAKLYAVIKEDKPTTSYYDVAENMCRDMFKMNLYPVAFPYTDDWLWHKYGLDDLTGIKSKYIYRTWCYLHRFPWIYDQVSKYQPKLILAMGVDYLTDYVVCFAGKNGTDDIFVEEIQPQSENNQKVRRIYWARLNGNRILAVIPHFSGPYGLNSDYLLKKVGERIKAILQSS